MQYNYVKFYDFILCDTNLISSGQIRNTFYYKGLTVEGKKEK